MRVDAKPAGWVRQIRGAWQLLRQGGVVVRTPLASPSILTVMQLDGDIVIFVAADVLARFRTVESRNNLIRQHMAALGAALPDLTGMTRPLRSLGLLAACALQAGIAAAWLACGWDWRFGIAHLAALAPIGLGWLGRPILLCGLRWALRRELRSSRLAFAKAFKARGIDAFKPG